MKEEILGWRDERISEQHKTYGHDCPMIDMDFICAEFDQCAPKGLCEYKHCNVGLRGLAERPGSQVLAALGDAAGLPAWIAIYDPVGWSYRVVPLNDLARQVFPCPRHFTEREYVALLYQIRGREAPAELLAMLHGDLYRD